jgi:hypothetical protein
MGLLLARKSVVRRALALLRHIDAVDLGRVAAVVVSVLIGSRHPFGSWRWRMM